MAYDIHSLFDFSGGMVTRYVNPANAPKNILTAGRICDITKLALATRSGYSILAQPWNSSMRVTSLHQAKFVRQGQSYLIAQVSGGEGQDFGYLSESVVSTTDLGGINDEITDYITTSNSSLLFAADNTAGDDDLVFYNIYDLGSGADLVNIATLNDRAVITEGIINRPLVFAGCLTSDGSDWAIPKTVLATMDGQTFFDLTSELCDPDLNTTAVVSLIDLGGAFYICMDTPKIEGIYFDAAAPANDVDCTVYWEGFIDGNWRLLPYSDGTTSGGVPFARSGVVYFGEVELDQVQVSEVSGYWVRFSLGFTPSQVWWQQNAVTSSGVDFLDLKRTIYQWASSSTIHHGQFQTSVGGVVTVGGGYTNTDIGIGCRIVFSSGQEAIITSISNGGAGLSDVIINNNVGSGVITGIYAGKYESGGVSISQDMGWVGLTNTQTTGTDVTPTNTDRYLSVTSTLSTTVTNYLVETEVQGNIKYWAAGATTSQGVFVGAGNDFTGDIRRLSCYYEYGVHPLLTPQGMW